MRGAAAAHPPLCPVPAHIPPGWIKLAHPQRGVLQQHARKLVRALLRLAVWLLRAVRPRQRQHLLQGRQGAGTWEADTGAGASINRLLEPACLPNTTAIIAPLGTSARLHAGAQRLHCASSLPRPGGGSKPTRHRVSSHLHAGALRQHFAALKCDVPVHAQMPHRLAVGPRYQLCDWRAGHKLRVGTGQR